MNVKGKAFVLENFIHLPKSKAYINLGGISSLNYFLDKGGVLIEVYLYWIGESDAFIVNEKEDLDVLAFYFPQFNQFLSQQEEEANYTLHVDLSEDS